MSAPGAGGREVLARALRELESLRARLGRAERARRAPVAVVGIGCRFPGGADGPGAFWRLLREGRDAVGPVPPERWDAEALYDPDPDAPGKCYARHGAFLRGVDRFDARFFGISAREAAAMDPQQRLLLEVAWEALEDAGIAPPRLARTRTGVYVGIGIGDYALLTRDAGAAGPYAGTGNGFCFAAGRLSYHLGVHGPSLALDTACSSSLVAVHLAMGSLRAGECDVALAGGVNLALAPDVTRYLCGLRALSPGGRCRTFDAAADGYVRGEGCGVVALKRLDDAVAAGDRVLAVLRGSAVNHDGPGSGLTVPSGPAQRRLLRDALADAGVDPMDVGCVEAHGTGTPLGDPVEVAALAEVYGGRPAGRPLALGSVKTNLGHLEPAAGIAGLIKAVLAVHHGVVPPHLHLREPNPRLALAQLGAVIPAAPLPWPAAYPRRIAAVSAFGLSGTNAHVVVEAPPVAASALPARPLHLLCLSGQSDAALREQARRLAAHLDAQVDGDAQFDGDAPAVADVCRTLSAGRAHFAHRRAVPVASAADVRKALDEAMAGAEPGRGAAGEIAGAPAVAFLFPGQGAQHAEMGVALHAAHPVFREALERCGAALGPLLGVPLMDVLRAPAAASRLGETACAQPAIFAVEYALLELWRSWGVRPAAVLGHSVGEVAAACAAGMLSLDDAAALVAERGRIVQQLAPGAMAAVFADAQAVAPVLAGLGGAVEIAAYNAPGEVVISGDRDGVAAALEALRGAGVRARALPAAHAFHSAMMEPALPALSAAAGRARFRPAEVDFVSSVTGTLVDAGAAARPEYWAAQLRAPVRFADAVRALRAAGCTAFVEIGPQPTLLALARRTLPDEAGPFLPSLRPGRGDWETLLGSLARLHALGVEVDWDGFERPFASRPVSLPTYPFERRRHWIDVPAAPPSLDGDSAPAASSVDGFAASPVDGSAAPRASAGGAPVFASPAARAGSSNASGSTAHPLLGVRLDSPLDDVQFEVELAADSPALLDDHRVYGVPVVSGPTLAAMVAEAAARLAPGAAAAIENAAFVEPILLPPGERRTAQLVLHPLAAGRWEWRVLSRAAAGGGWTLHATGSLSTSSTPAGAAPHPDTVRLRLDEALTGGELYERVQRRAGFEFGRAYLWIDRLWRGPGEALGRFRAPDADEAGFERYRLHPGLHDSCFQVFGACSEAVMRAGDQDAVVPLGIDRLVVHAPARGDLWCHATLLPGEAGRDDMFSGGYTLFDAAGRVVLEARGLRLRRARREVMTRALRRPAGAALYRRAWHPAPPPPSADLSTSDETDAGAWLVVSGDAAGAGRLARALAARGQACTVATLAGAPHANGGPVLRAAAAGDFRRAVDALAVPGTPPLRGIVVIAGDEPPGSGDLAAFTAVAAVSGDASPVSGVVPVSADGAARHPAGNAGRDVLAATLSALQALAGRAWAGGAPGVWAVTRGAVDAGAEPLRVDAAAAWGLGRVAALEHPDLWRGCVDLPPASDDGEWARLADELLAGGGEDQVALRPGVRLAARLERVETVDADTDGAAPLVSADGSYLVTGGLGALGMELARWLAARGAGRVVLAGRSAPGAEARRALDELAAGGARVETACCDVAARGEVAALLGRIRREGPPLRGVFHAAGVLDDGALALQTAARFDAVMAPKTCGARHLHELTRGDAIGHFVLFSSAAALLGSAGQGGYAAANAVLDALAAGRRRAGLPALSVQWGPWTGGGMAASAPERAAWRARGISPLEPAQALAAMQRAMTAGAAAVAVLSVDWEAYAATAPRPDPLLATMVRPRPAAPAAPARPPTPDLPRRLRDAPADTRLALLRDHVRAEAARILGEDEGPGPRERFWEVGMDSLMAVELRGRLQSTLGVPLPATVVLDRPTVNQLAEHLLALVVRPEPAVHHGAVAASSSPHLPTAPGAADETEGWSAYDPAAVEAVRDLTDEETDALLLRELSALEGAP